MCEVFSQTRLVPSTINNKDTVSTLRFQFTGGAWGFRFIYEIITIRNNSNLAIRDMWELGIKTCNLHKDPPNDTQESEVTIIIWQHTMHNSKSHLVFIFVSVF